MGTPETNRASAGWHELTVEKWVYGGNGLGRLDGRAVLVPYVLPGELVQIKIEREKPGLLEARLAAVLSPAPERANPPCPFFSRCGGCQYQHADYEFQLTQKLSVLREVFRRVGKLQSPEQIGLISASPWEYRNRAKFHLAGGKIGYLETGSHRLCPVDRCPISSPRINEALAVLCKMLHNRRFPRFLRSLELFTNETEVQLNVLASGRPIARPFFEWCAERIPGAAAGSLDYQAAGNVYRVSHSSFFQVNRFLVDRLVECALDEAEGETAIDLYAGVGLFSLHLAGRFRAVTAVEASRSALRDLEFNAERAGVKIDARRNTAEAFLEGLEEPGDLMLADPPRRGLGKGVVHHLVRLRPRHLTIVSCDPATLARDLAPLVAAGYRIEKLTLVDLFPQTYHIETVTHLRTA
jgi:23S rRNA (uracil1939-C5)-methyltransferase